MKIGRMLFVILLASTALALVLMGGCSIIDDVEGAALLYNGNKYFVAEYWTPIRDDDYTKEIGSWQGHEHDIRLFSDSRKRFLFDEYFQLMFHLDGDPLPNIGNAEAIEKLRISFSDIDREMLIIDDRHLVAAITEIMGQPYHEDAFKSNNAFDYTVASIDVYFVDYPAYCRAALVIAAKDGGKGVVISEWYENNNVKANDYTQIPQDNPLISLVG